MYGAALTADGGNEVEVTMVDVVDETLVDILVLLALMLLPFEALLCFDDDKFVPAADEWFIGALCL